MIKKLFIIALMCNLSTAGAAICTTPNAIKIPANTPFYLGPNAYNIVLPPPQTPPSYNPSAYGLAILAARDTWNVTNAAHRIGDWNLKVSSSDCPTGLPFQIGAFGFAGSTCASVIYNPYVNSNTLAFVDYNQWCYGCGTMSVSVNLNFAWSTNPLPHQYDVQSVMTHEFGHVLGLMHQDGGACNPQNAIVSKTCASDINRETMGAETYDGETCMRDLTANDISSANFLYP